MTIQEAFDSFLQQYNNQPVEKEDIADFDQCMDLAFAWVDVLNIPRETIRHQYAYQVFTEQNASTVQFFDSIPNTPTAVPQKGDLVVFDTTVGVAGHICISDGVGDTITFESFDQNWDTHHVYHLDAAGNHIPYSRVITHNYNGVLGWLHPKNVSLPGDYYKGIDLHNPDSVKTAIDTWDAVAHNQYVPTADWNAIAAILGLPAGSTKDAMRNEITQLQKQKIDAETTTQAIKQQVPDLTARAEQAEAKAETLTLQLENEKKLAENNQAQSYRDLYTALSNNYNAKSVAWEAQFKTDVASFSQLKRNNIYYLPTGQIFNYWLQRITGQQKQTTPPPLTPEDFKYADSVPVPPIIAKLTSGTA